MTVPISYTGRYVATCTACPLWRNAGRTCPVCEDSGKVVRERHPTSISSAVIGPAPADAPLGPFDPPEHKRNVHREAES